VKRGVLDLELLPSLRHPTGERHLAVLDHHHQVSRAFAQNAGEHRTNVTQDA